MSDRQDLFILVMCRFVLKSYQEMPEQILEDLESLCSTPADSVSVASDTTSNSEDVIIEGY